MSTRPAGRGLVTFGDLGTRNSEQVGNLTSAALRAYARGARGPVNSEQSSADLGTARRSTLCEDDGTPAALDAAHPGSEVPQIRRYSRRLVRGALATSDARGRERTAGVLGSGVELGCKRGTQVGGDQRGPRRRLDHRRLPGAGSAPPLLCRPPAHLPGPRLPSLTQPGAWRPRTRGPPATARGPRLLARPGVGLRWRGGAGAATARSISAAVPHADALLCRGLYGGAETAIRGDFFSPARVRS
jgi:hypothetical protein